MRFLLSRLYALVIMATWVWLCYRMFSASRPIALMVSIFVGAFLMRASTDSVFDWGNGSRAWGANCKYAVFTGLGFIAASVAAVLLTR